MSSEMRKASAVIAVREGERAPQVLVVERGRATRFLPGYVSFPGGRTDDTDPGLASRWFRDADESARACAVRELAEEVGLALTASGLRPVANGRTPEIATSDPLQPIHRDPPSTGQLARIARWVAPEQVPVRYDALYFAVATTPGIEPVPDGGEIAAAWWTGVSDLLEEWSSGGRRLYWPTYFTMLALARCGSVADLLKLDISTREPTDDELSDLPDSVFRQDA